MITRVQSYQASDGSVHTDLDSAKHRELALICGNGNRSSDPTQAVEDALACLVARADEVVQILRKTGLVRNTPVKRKKKAATQSIAVPAT